MSWDVWLNLGQHNGTACAAINAFIAGLKVAAFIAVFVQVGNGGRKK